MIDTQLFSYDRLAEIYRAEARDFKLTPVPRDLYVRIQDYLANAQINVHNELDDPNSHGKYFTISHQIERTIELAERLVNYRIEKIMLLAHREVRGTKINNSWLTNEELELRDSVKQVVSAYLKKVCPNYTVPFIVINGRLYREVYNISDDETIQLGVKQFVNEEGE